VRQQLAQWLVVVVGQCVDVVAGACAGDELSHVDPVTLCFDRLCWSDFFACLGLRGAVVSYCTCNVSLWTRTYYCVLLVGKQ